MSSNSSQADSAGSIPVTRSTDRISQASQPSFASYNGTVPLRVSLAILASAPGRLSVPKLTVRLQFPHPLQTRRALRRCSGEEFPYCVKAAGYADSGAASCRACGLRMVPPCAAHHGRAVDDGIVGVLDACHLLLGGLGRLPLL